MLGIYDSGSGGLTALSALRALAPRANILYRGDLLRAPYGTRSREELLPIIRENLTLLRRLGAEQILVACMTASSLSHLLPKQEQKGVTPIIDCVAERAIATTRTGRVGIVSTTRTMREGRLRDRLLSHNIQPTESVGDALVPLAERGEIFKESPEVRKAIADAVAVHQRAGVDTLILGCTHFPYFTDAFREALGDEVHLIPSGEVGAEEFFTRLPKNVLQGKGHIHFI